MRRLPDWRLRALEEVLAEIDVGIVGEQLRGRLHVAVRDAVAFVQQRASWVNSRSTLLDLGGRAIDDDVVPLRPNPDAELRLEVLQVLVVGAEERLDARFPGSVILATCILV